MVRVTDCVRNDLKGVKGRKTEIKPNQYFPRKSRLFHKGHKDECRGCRSPLFPFFPSPYLSSPSTHSFSLPHFSLLNLSPFPLFPIFSIPPPPISPLTHTPFSISLPMPPSINIPYPKNWLSSPLFAFVISVDILEKIQLRANSFARVFFFFFFFFFLFFFAGEYNFWQAVSVYFDYRPVYNRRRQNSFVL